MSAVTLQVLSESKPHVQADSMLLPSLLPLQPPQSQANSHSSDTQTDHSKAGQKDAVEICCNALYDTQDCADSQGHADDHVFLGKSLEVTFSEEVKENMLPGNYYMSGVKQHLNTASTSRSPLQPMHTEPSTAATASPLGLLAASNSSLHHDHQRNTLHHHEHQPNSLLHGGHHPSSAQMQHWQLSQPSALLIRGAELVQPVQQLLSHGTRSHSPSGSSEMGLAEQGGVSQDSDEAFRELLKAAQQQRVSNTCVLCV